MAKKKEKMENPNPEEVVAEETAEETTPEVNEWEEKYNAQYDSYLRLAADYDNYRKRTAKEKDAAYGNGKADAIEKILPVYDNLERALQQDTALHRRGLQEGRGNDNDPACWHFGRPGRGDLRQCG